MPNAIRKTLFKISRMGIEPGLNPVLTRYLIITNYASMGHVLMTFPYFFILRYLQTPILSIMVLPLTLFYASVPLINRMGLVNFSRLAVITMTNLNVYVYSASLGPQASLNNVFYFTLVVPLLLFHTSEWRKIVFCITQPVVLWALVALKGNWFIPQTVMEPWALDIMSPAISITSALLLFGCCFFVFTTYQTNETKLIAAQQFADASNLAKDEFLATISHEIRTPMNGVLGMMELMSRTDLTAAQIDYLRIMKISGDLLMTVLNDILDFSKLQSGNVQLESLAFDIDGIVDLGLRLIEKDATEKNIRLGFLREEGCPRWVVGDATRYSQVVLNLLNNAVKFTRSGSITLDLRLTGGSDANPELTLTVRDTGIGISRAGMEKLFASFSQVDSSITREFGGTGLGLAICKKLSKLMGGDIRVESAEGVGSAFSFSATFSRVS